MGEVEELALVGSSFLLALVLLGLGMCRVAKLADRNEESPHVVLWRAPPLTPKTEPRARSRSAGRGAAANAPPRAQARALDIRDALIDRIAAVIEDGRLRGADEAPTTDVPARALVGGIFRALPFATQGRGGRLHEIRPATLAWIDSYSLIGGATPWQTASARESLNVSAGTPVEPTAPPLGAPPARGSLGEREGPIERAGRW